MISTSEEKLIHRHNPSAAIRKSKGAIIDEMFKTRDDIKKSLEILNDVYTMDGKRAYHRERIIILAERLHMYADALKSKIGSKRHRNLILSIFNRHKKEFQQFLGEKYDYESWRGSYVSITEKKVITSEDYYLITTVHDMLIKYIDWIAAVNI